MEKRPLKRTKIICTLGPASDTKEQIKTLILKGMDAARFNFSHVSEEEALKKVNIVKELRKELDIPVSLILDTKGPEVRLYGYNKPRSLKKDQVIKIQSAIDLKTETEDKNIYKTNLPNIDNLVKENHKILLMDGYFEGRVIDRSKDEISVKIFSSGTIRPKAHLTIPKIDYPLPFLSDQDKENIIFAVKQNFDYIALSFVRDANDLFKIRSLVFDTDPESKIKLISKVENKKAIDNIDSIISHSDGIMVARGDLGVELDIEEVPIIQKKIIEQCYLSGRPVITATQMLESMIDSPIPTRAEASDVANACFDMTSVVMLSGETAIGKFPDKVVNTMTNIIKQVENAFKYESTFFTRRLLETEKDLTTIVTHNAVSTAYHCNAKAIVVLTKSGYSARMLSKLRPGLPIYAFTYERDIYYQLALNWGVTPYLINEIVNDESNFEKLIKSILNDCENKNLVDIGDLVVIVSGLPLGKQGTTNMIRIETIGKRRFTGKCIGTEILSGNIVYCDSEIDLKKKEISNKIVVLKNFKEEYASYLKFAKAVVMETEDYNKELRLLSLAYNMVVFQGARGLSELLKEGALVEIAGDKNLLIEL